MKMQLKTSLTNSVRLLAVAGILSASASVHAKVGDLVCEMGSINYWGDGFVITDITVTNDYADEIDWWFTNIDFAEGTEIVKVWNAELMTDSDNESAVIKSSDHNSVLLYGESASFGLMGTYSGEWVEPECVFDDEDSDSD